MDIILPIHKNFADMIYSGEKDLEFRNKKIRLEENDKVYIYETKNTGCGKVTGYFMAGRMEEIPPCKCGTYTMLPHFTQKFGTEEEISVVKEAMEVHLDKHDDSLILDYLFNKKVIEEMKISHNPPNFSNFYDMVDCSLVTYIEQHNRSVAFCNRCDKWLTKIGFFDEYGESNWKYQIPIKEVHKFDEPKDITNFILMDGRPVKLAPQAFCYTRGFVK